MKKSSKVFIAYLVVAVAVFTYSLYIGKEQIQERKEDYMSYLTANELITEGSSVETAMVLLEDVMEKYVVTESMLLDKILGYRTLEQYDSVEKTIEEIFEMNESLKQNSTIMLLYAEALVETNNKEKASEALEKIKQLEVNEEQQKTLDELVKKIG